MLAIERKMMDRHDRMELLVDKDYDRYFRMLELACDEAEAVAGHVMYLAHRHGCVRIEKEGLMNRVYNMEDGKVLEDDSMARKLLPTEEGFFFGGTGYDQWYWLDLEDTLTQLDKILGMVERKHGELDYNCKGEDDWNLTLQYHSSW